ncbi:hypothetical protein Salat_1485900 [Sesamum alatum]|uniref:Uncharacterized protein n=1 Tax=Sesamum alatum TaxID=300844 RepID=A0AAE1YBQ6_9LAMI|nr:hypothetical protein Salat_1485900 [Sesamum alatum]
MSEWAQSITLQLSDLTQTPIVASLFQALQLRGLSLRLFLREAISYPDRSPPPPWVRASESILQPRLVHMVVAVPSGPETHRSTACKSTSSTPTLVFRLPSSMRMGAHPTPFQLFRENSILVANGKTLAVRPQQARQSSPRKMSQSSPAARLTGRAGKATVSRKMNFIMRASFIPTEELQQLNDPRSQRSHHSPSFCALQAEESIGIIIL